MAIKPLKINVQDLLKKYVSENNKDKRFIKAITPILKNNAIKKEIGLRNIDAIIERTLSGVDKNGKDFKPYKKDKNGVSKYRQSAIFKIYKGNKIKPDLKLTGDMQTSIDVTKISGDEITIWFNNLNESRKAEGHVMGTGGHGGLPVRDFWGLPTQEIQMKIIEDILRQYNTENINEIIQL